MSPALHVALIDAIANVTDGDEAARDLARRWRATLREQEAAADRIRRSVRDAPCSCARPADPPPDGRCQRCYGRGEEGAP